MLVLLRKGATNPLMDNRSTRFRPRKAKDRLADSKRGIKEIRDKRIDRACANRVLVSRNGVEGRRLECRWEMKSKSEDRDKRSCEKIEKSTPLEETKCPFIAREPVWKQFQKK